MKTNHSSAFLGFRNTRTLLPGIPFLLLLFAFIISKSSFSQLTIDTLVSQQQLVNSILEPGTLVSNVKVNCHRAAAGTFTGDSNIGLASGILLTNGKTSIANGPNNSTRAGFNLSTPGDLHLDSISGTTTYDGCSLEFDLASTGNVLKVNYVFGSEEYPEYVNKTFNDLFAIFLSGPGISGIKNIACIPNTSIPVSINSVNSQSHSEYYTDNAGGASIQYDGFTKPMGAYYPVLPNHTYHLKIAIADATDAIYDSGVFIKAGSVGCSTVLEVKNNSLDATTQVYPNPANDIIYIQTPAVQKPLTVSIYSTIGKLVHQETYLNSGQTYPIHTDVIDADGIYFVKIQSDEEFIIRKIQINH